MTGLYNVLERLRELDNDCDVEALSETERKIHETGLISVLKCIHDDIDRATFEAYGWPDLADILGGKPGATLPSPYKRKAQEAAEQTLLARLVALNLERREEENRGIVRWLRPDYQIPKLGSKSAASEQQLDVDTTQSNSTIAGKPKWPADGLDQIRIIKDMLTSASTPTQANAIASTFDGKLSAARCKRVEEVLKTLVIAGAARTAQLNGETRYFTPGPR